MATLEKRHIPRTGASALLGGTVVGAVGYLVGGPPGLVLGVVVGVAAGALLGNRMAVAADPDDSAARFKEYYRSMGYYEPGMQWKDYAPAYRYGLETWRTRGGSDFASAEPAMGAHWLKVRGESRLAWGQARGPVEHVWRDMEETLRQKGR